MSLDIIYEEIIKNLDYNDNPTLYIIRGLPTSGKTYIGNLLSQKLKCMHIDPDKLITYNNVYNYSEDNFSESLFRCKKIIYDNLKYCDIIISDVLPRKRDVLDFISIALELKCNYKVIDLPLYSKSQIIKRVRSRYLSGHSSMNNINEIDLDRMIDDWQDWKY